MTTPNYQEVADGVYCIETGLYRHGLAACYLVRSGDRLAFLETGTANSVPGLLEVVAELGLTPNHVDYVMPTHVHLDHAGGAGELMARCPNARLIIHPKGAEHMIDPSKLAAGATAVYGEEEFALHFGELLPIAEARVIIAEEGMEANLNGRRLIFTDTPGHANHHGCWFDEPTRGVFSGDTFGISYRELDTEQGPMLFAPTTPVAFDPEAWQHSVDKIMAFDPQAIYLTHYCRVDDPQRLAEVLRRSIRDMAAIALEEESRDQAGRSERLRDAVASHLVSQARDNGCALEDSEIRAILGVDIDLNAQGLEVWLARRAKKDADETAQPPKAK